MYITKSKQLVRGSDRCKVCIPLLMYMLSAWLCREAAVNCDETNPVWTMQPVQTLLPMESN